MKLRSRTDALGLYINEEHERALHYIQQAKDQDGFVIEHIDDNIGEIHLNLPIHIYFTCMDYLYKHNMC